MIQETLQLTAPSTRSTLHLGLGADPKLLQIAVQLRSVRLSAAKAVSIMVIPVSEGQSAWPVTREIGAALQQMREGPVLAVDLNAALSPTSSSLSGSDPQVDAGNELTFGSDGELSPAWTSLFGKGDCTTLTIARLNAMDGGSLPVGERLSLFLAQAKRMFQYTLISGATLQNGVASLMTAPMCDKTILLAGRGEAKIGEISRAKNTLLTAQADLLGFIFDETPSKAHRKR